MQTDENQPLHDNVGTNGRLVLIGTPIGNLGDMSTRAVKALREADVLLCEDTRRTGLLLQQLKVERSGPTLSFHDHSPAKALEKLRNWFREGKTIAFVSDGGMPSVADPGFVLVRLAKQVGAKVTTVPGPTAVAAFFAVCGLESPKFFFHGFFPRTRGEIDKVVETIKALNVVHIFYESPHRLIDTLEVFVRNAPYAALAVGRELTKLHEEIVNGTAEELVAEFSKRDRVRGECVIGILGGEAQMALQKPVFEDEENQDVSKPTLDPYTPDPPREQAELTPEQHQMLVAELQSGRSAKEIAKEFSKRFGISRRALYDYVVRRLT